MVTIPAIRIEDAAAARLLAALGYEAKDGPPGQFLRDRIGDILAGYVVAAERADEDAAQAAAQQARTQARTRIKSEIGL